MRHSEKTKDTIRVHISDKMVLIAFGFAIAYWLIDTFLFLFLSYDVQFLERIFGPQVGQIASRVIVLCLFAMFGSHVQFTINKRKAAEKKSREEAITRERFQRLLSPELAEMVVSGKMKVEKGGKSRYATVLFADIRSFTAISENMDAAEVFKMLNEYFEVIVAVVFSHNGMIDKFIGDEVMAIWGTPAADDDNSVRAVRAALEIQSVLVEFNKKRKAENKIQLQMGVGINTGNLMAGYIGSTQTMNYSVIGDTVNTASILCSSAKGGQVVISENTYNSVKDIFKATELEAIHAKKHKPVRAFSVHNNT